MRCLLIINPRSRSGGDTRAELLREFRQRGVDLVDRYGSQNGGLRTMSLRLLPRVAVWALVLAADTQVIASPGGFFAPATDVELIDHGTMIVSAGGVAERRETFEMHANLWEDEAHRPIKFTIGLRISGIREGFEGIDAELVAQ